MKKFTVILVASIIAFTLVLPVSADAAWWPFAKIFGLKGTPTPTPLGTPVPIDCIAAAIYVRDGTILNAWDKYHDAITVAVKTRSATLVKAWALTKKQARKQALANAWSQYNQAVADAKLTFKKGKLAAQNQYRKDMKKCGDTNDEEPADAGEDDL